MGTGGQPFVGSFTTLWDLCGETAGWQAGLSTMVKASASHASTGAVPHPHARVANI